MKNIELMLEKVMAEGFAEEVKLEIKFDVDNLIYTVEIKSDGDVVTTEFDWDKKLSVSNPELKTAFKMLDDICGSDFE